MLHVIFVNDPGPKVRNNYREDDITSLLFHNGVGLISGFKIYEDFMEADRVFNTDKPKGKGEVVSGHSMLMVGHYNSSNGGTILFDSKLVESQAIYCVYCGVFVGMYQVCILYAHSTISHS